ncbi:MAG: transposase family protein [Thermoguttaceae bacterium]|nr:transposase family protein [Thermoguttaceae bacterium]
MLTSSLRLEEPWYITGAEFGSVQNEVHIHVGVRKDVTIPCPKCGGSTTRYGYEPTERRWRHSDCFFYRRYVHCQRPRVLCERCGAQKVNAPFERLHGRFTLLLEAMP